GTLADLGAIVARIGVDRPILIGVGRVFAERARFASTIAHARGCAITGEAHRAWRGPPNATDDLEALVDAC
ncbi:MAG: uroporphyrinogen-III C-methyltransferase, partial [Aurantimonas coralicida]